MLISYLTEKFLPYHESWKTLKPFIVFHRLAWFCVVILVLIASTLFSLFGLKFTEEDGYIADPTGNTIFLILGMCIFIVALLLMVFVGIIIPISFQRSQNKFMNSDKFKSIKLKVNSENFLKKLSKKELKHFKKLLYIDKQTYILYNNNFKKIKTSK